MEVIGGHLEVGNGLDNVFLTSRGLAQPNLPPIMHINGGVTYGGSPPDEVLGPHQVVTPFSLKTQILRFRDLF